MWCSSLSQFTATVCHIEIIIVRLHVRLKSSSLTMSSTTYTNTYTIILMGVQMQRHHSDANSNFKVKFSFVFFFVGREWVLCRALPLKRNFRISNEKLHFLTYVFCRLSCISVMFINCNRVHYNNISTKTKTTHLHKHNIYVRQKEEKNLTKKKLKLNLTHSKLSHSQCNVHFKDDVVYCVFRFFWYWIVSLSFTLTRGTWVRF